MIRAGLSILDLSLSRASCVALAIGIVVAPPLFAAEVSITPRIEVRQAFTDNVTLDAGGDGGDNDFVTGLFPGLDIQVNGRRGDVRLSYTSELFYFSNLDTFDDRHRVNGGFRFDLIGSELVLEGIANVVPTFVQQGAAFSQSPFNLSDDRRLVQTYSVGPRFRRRLNRYMRVDANYRFGLIQSSVDDEGSTIPGIAFADSTNHVGSFGISGNNPRSRLDWRIGGNGFISDRDDFPVFRQGEATLDLSFEVTPNFRLLAAGGYFAANVVNLFNSGEGVVVNGGFAFNGSKTSITGRGGVRAGVTTFSGDVVYRAGRRLSLNVSYIDRLSTSQTNLLSTGFAPQPPVFGPTTPIVPTPPGDIDGGTPPVLVPGFENFDDFLDGAPGLPFNDSQIDPIGAPGFDLTDLAFRQRRALASVVYRRSTVQATLTGFFERRDFDVDETPAEGFGGTMQFNYTAPSGLGANVLFSYRRDEFIGLDRTDDLFSGTAGLSYRIGQTLTTGAQYQFVVRESSLVFAEFQENSVSLFLRATF